MGVNDKLKVVVLNGLGLKCRDASKEVTPYCLLQLGQMSHETRYIGSNSNPEWNEEFVFDVISGCEVLSFSIWHKNTLKNDVVIGYAFVDFGGCKKGEKTSVNIQLQGIYSGEINLSILPMYETTASKVERLEHQILILTYEVSKYSGKLERLHKKVTDLTLENHKLNKANKILEKERNTLLEYEILSMCGSPIQPRAVVCNHSVDNLHRNGVSNVKTSPYPDDDDFDIITEGDIDLALNIYNKNKEEKDSPPEMLVDITRLKKKNDAGVDVNKFTLNDWGRHFSESIELLEEEIERWNTNDKHEKNTAFHDNSKITKLRNENNELGRKVTDLESENSELKILLRQMKLKNDEELSLFIHQVKLPKDDDQDTDETIRNKINTVNTEKLETDAKIDILKEVMLDLDIGINILSVADDVHHCNKEDMKGEADPYPDDDTENQELYYEESITSSDRHDIDEDMLEKLPDEPDVIREYFWDEYLPISTRHSNNGEEDNEMMLDDIHDIVDSITEDIDEFIRTNYIFHNENTLILRSDPELYTRSDIEEENEHFKDINIRLIKENEELDGCLRLLEIQVKNLKKIQSILFEQLIKRAPTYMKYMMDTITDGSQILTDDQVTLYTTHFGAVLDEMINITVEPVYSDTKERSDYDFAISLLYHQLST